MNQRQSTDQWIGQDIGNGDNCRYHIEQLIGKGGTGEVYVAVDNQLGRRVALKILRGHLAHDSKMREHFEREVSLCTAIKSEHVVLVSDFGVTQQGRPFYVMELLQGKTLRQFLQEQRQLPWQDVIKLALQICQGLEPAHNGVQLFNKHTQTAERVKVIHCDLKPDNIFLIPTFLGNFVKILDFGIAKLRCLEEGGEETIPVSSGFWGTFRYAAPEQLEESNLLDERVDIYSLGVMLYEMLAGTDPFGLSQEDTTAMSWALAHTTKTPIPLRQCPHCEDIPRELEGIIMRCIEKLPEKRIASVTDLKTALLLVDADQPPIPITPTRGWYKVAFITASVFIVAAVAGVLTVDHLTIKKYERELMRLHGTFRYEECVSYADSLPFRNLPTLLKKERDQCLLDWAGDMGGLGLFEEAFTKLARISENSLLKEEALDKINLFSQTILEKGDRYCDQGKWELAVVDAKHIPSNSASYDQAQLLIEKWQRDCPRAMQLYEKAKKAYAQKKWLEVIDASYCFPEIKGWQEKMKPMVVEAQSALSENGVNVPRRVCPK